MGFGPNPESFDLPEKEVKTKEKRERPKKKSKIVTGRFNAFKQSPRNDAS